MRVRWLLIDTEVLLRSLEAGATYRVRADEVPRDATVLEAHACGPRSIALLISSNEFAQVTRGDVPELRPILEVTPDRRPRSAELSLALKN
jgi:hypothetical protein